MLELNLDARGGMIMTAIWSIGLPKDCLVRVKCALNSRNNILLDNLFAYTLACLHLSSIHMLLIYIDYRVNIVYLSGVFF